MWRSADTDLAVVVVVLGSVVVVVGSVVVVVVVVVGSVVVVAGSVVDSVGSLGTSEGRRRLAGRSTDSQPLERRHAKSPQLTTRNRTQATGQTDADAHTNKNHRLRPATPHAAES